VSTFTPEEIVLILIDPSDPSRFTDPETVPTDTFVPIGQRIVKFFDRDFSSAT
jgi:hypothetical protein